MQDELFVRRAIELSRLAVENESQIYTRHDPTFHGEAGLLRKFCARTAITDLHDYTLYSSCEPCFMCSGAMGWTKLGRLVYAASNIDLEEILGKRGSRCSEIVFENSSWRPARGEHRGPEELFHRP